MIHIVVVRVILPITITDLVLWAHVLMQAQLPRERVGQSVLREPPALDMLHFLLRVEPHQEAKHKLVIVRVRDGQEVIPSPHLLPHQRVRRIRHLLLRVERMEQLAKVKPVSQMVVGREPIRLPLLPQ